MGTVFSLCFKQDCIEVSMLLLSINSKICLTVYLRGCSSTDGHLPRLFGRTSRDLCVAVHLRYSIISASIQHLLSHWLVNVLRHFQISVSRRPCIFHGTQNRPWRSAGCFWVVQVGFAIFIYLCVVLAIGALVICRCGVQLKYMWGLNGLGHSRLSHQLPSLNASISSCIDRSCSNMPCPNTPPCNGAVSLPPHCSSRQ